MKPIKREFEKVKTDDFVTGVIDSYQFEEQHVFKGPIGNTTNSAIRFKFVIDGCEYPKYSRWMTFSYNEKANLYLKYLTALVKGAKPNMDFDLDQLVGVYVKMLWKNDIKNPDFQSLDVIRPVGDLVTPLNSGESIEEERLPF